MFPPRLVPTQPLTWAEFPVNDLEDRYAGLQGIGWPSLVTDGEKAEFVARTRSDGEAGFTIRPPGRRPVYYVTLFSYPRLPSSTLLGADARADPGVLATLDEAP